MYKFRVVTYLLLIIEWLILLYFGQGHLQGQILSISLFLFSFYQICNAIGHKQIWLAVAFFFMLSYSYEPVKYYWLGENINPWRRACQTPTTVYQVAMCVYLFLITMCYCIDYRNAARVYKTRPFVFHSDFILWFACLALGIVMAIIGRSGDNIFASGGYGRGDTQGSTAFEYAQIPMIIALCYSYTRKRKVITISVISLYVIKDLAYGGRIETVMIALLVYMVLLRHKFSLRQTAIVVFVGFFILTFWGGLRHNTGQDVNAIATSAWEEISVSTANSQDVYYASMRVIYMIEHGILTVAQRISSFTYFLLSTVVPYSDLPPTANLASFYNTHLGTGGGGLAPVFIYAWTGYVGIIVFGVFVGRILSSLIKGTCGKYLFFYGIFLVAFVPRWYAYYPVNLIKLCVYAVLFFMVTESIRTRKLPFAG